MTAPATLKDNLNRALAWAERFNELSMRERLFVSSAVVGLICALWFYFVYSYFENQQAIVERDVLMTKEEARTIDEKTQEFIRVSAQDPNVPLTAELNGVREDLNTMNANLQLSLSQFIPPSAMTLVLRDLMADHKNLTLTLLSRLPTRQLLPDEESANLYLHPMRLELEGTYLDVLDYVQSLENGDWQFNWQSFQYKTTDYPYGVATIEIETLSKDKHWLGI